jgi:glycosyltransferase involved in cell wall biosynthesis
MIEVQLAALLAQEGAPRFEVLLCDNNSTDGTVQRALAAACDLDLRIIDASGPTSASFARNRGAEAARGEVLLFCDADDLVDVRWAAELCVPFGGGADVLVAGALHHERFNDREVLAAYGISSDPHPSDVAAHAEAPAYAGYLPTVPGGNFGIRREHYLDLRGMDASYPGGAEETDFAWRAQHLGIPVVIRPGAIVHYRLKASARSLFRQQRIQNNARILLWTRHRRDGMTGPSLRFSIIEVLRGLPTLLTARDRAGRLRAARILGGHVGALQGMLVFRMLRRTPAALPDTTVARSPEEGAR